MSWWLGPSPGVRKAGSWFEFAVVGLAFPLPDNFLTTRLCCPRGEGVEIVSGALRSQTCRVLRSCPGEREK